MDDLSGGARVGLLAHALAVPVELAEAAVDAEGVREKKKRSLPSVLIVYLNLVLWLYPEQGMGQCLRELAAGMPQLVRETATWRNVASTSISEARQRVGPGVMRAILVRLAGFLGRPEDLWRGRRVCAVDGTTVKVPDTDENAEVFGGPRSSPFPLQLTPTRVLEDGTYLARLKPKAKRDGPPITVRVIEYSVGSKTGALGGKATSEVFALVTNLTDPEQAPALELAGLYSRRWKIEVLYKTIKVDLNGVKPVLRSGHADTVLAEVWSLLTVYQILVRLAGAALTDHGPAGDDPGVGRISIKAARGAFAAPSAKQPPTPPKRWPRSPRRSGPPSPPSVQTGPLPPNVKPAEGRN